LTIFTADGKAVLKKVRYALCPMPYALCPMPYARRVSHVTEKGYSGCTRINADES